MPYEAVVLLAGLGWLSAVFCFVLWRGAEASVRAWRDLYRQAEDTLRQQMAWLKVRTAADAKIVDDLDALRRRLYREEAKP